ncbi:Hypothetical_protein [Hexamita inflata]|uniref:Hypothetical_protein n=1 Tax=Hexamita inflata TaxID=28002 RepID=A0AA86UW22_9EUKA|nr:Hypothetical protein HINF_LOCUS38688 [Hexamita inflata]
MNNITPLISHIQTNSSGCDFSPNHNLTTQVVNKLLNISYKTFPPCTHDNIVFCHGDQWQFHFVQQIGFVQFVSFSFKQHRLLSFIKYLITFCVIFRSKTSLPKLQRAIALNDFSSVDLYPTVTVNYITQLIQSPIIPLALTLNAPECATYISYLQTRLQQELPQFLTPFYKLLFQNRFFEKININWISFYRFFITTKFGQNLVLTRINGENPLILKLLEMDEGFIDIFYIELEETERKMLYGTFRMLSNAHKIDLLDTAFEKDFQIYKETVLGLNLQKFSAEQKIKIIQALIRGQKDAQINDRFEEVRQIGYLQALSENTTNGLLLANICDICKLYDEEKLLRIMLGKQIYTRQIEKLTTGSSEEKIHAACFLNSLCIKFNQARAYILQSQFKYNLALFSNFNIFAQFSKLPLQPCQFQTDKVQCYVSTNKQVLFLSPQIQDVMNRLQIKNAEIQRFVLKINGIECDYVVPKQLEAAYNFEVLLRTIIKYLNTGAKMLEKQYFIPFCHNLNINGQGNIQMFINKGVQQDYKFCQLKGIFIQSQSKSSSSNSKAIVKSESIQSNCFSIKNMLALVKKQLNNLQDYQLKYLFYEDIMELSIFSSPKQTEQSKNTIYSKILDSLSKIYNPLVQKHFKCDNDKEKYFMEIDMYILKQLTQNSERASMQISGKMTHKSISSPPSFNALRDGIMYASANSPQVHVNRVRELNCYCFLAVMSYFNYKLDDFVSFTELMFIQELANLLIESGITVNDEQVTFTEFYQFSFNLSAIDAQILQQIKNTTIPVSFTKSQIQQQISSSPMSILAQSVTKQQITSTPKTKVESSLLKSVLNSQTMPEQKTAKFTTVDQLFQKQKLNYEPEIKKPEFTHKGTLVKSAHQMQKNQIQVLNGPREFTNSQLTMSQLVVKKDAVKQIELMKELEVKKEEAVKNETQVELKEANQIQIENPNTLIEIPQKEEQKVEQIQQNNIETEAQKQIINELAVDELNQTVQHIPITLTQIPEPIPETTKVQNSIENITAPIEQNSLDKINSYDNKTIEDIEPEVQLIDPVQSQNSESKRKKRRNSQFTELLVLEESSTQNLPIQEEMPPVPTLDIESDQKQKKRKRRESQLIDSQQEIQDQSTSLNFDQQNETIDLCPLDLPPPEQDIPVDMPVLDVTETVTETDSTNKLKKRKKRSTQESIE